MINNILRVQSRISEIKDKVSQLDKVSSLKFKKELQNNIDNGDNKINSKLGEELAKINNILGDDNVADIEKLAPEFLKKVTGISSMESLKNKNSLDFYKTISEKLF
ncbi:MAG: hypothetical protein M0R46_00340 [Candidatus Muirbacterium halophilum]|nr:hypothetical protein [Candidatus Muirbacterium halophilum]MCK9474341.1 hypothetical protein [Candidatus Muirbacterium halophilum]